MTEDPVDNWSLAVVEERVDDAEVPDAMLGQAADLNINNHTREAAARQRFAFDDCEKLCNLIYNVLQLPWSDCTAAPSSVGKYSQSTTTAWSLLFWFFW